MCSYPQYPADSISFAEEILNGKLHFLCSETCKCEGVLKPLYHRDNQFIESRGFSIMTYLFQRKGANGLNDDRK